jgi:outer membrane protein assembly factor BamB
MKGERKMSKNKTAIAIALFLMFSMATSLLALPTINAHDPALSIKTYAFVSAAPDPVGVGQQIVVFMWLDKVPPTAWGDYGDRWEGMMLEFTAPDGDKETLGPFTSDPAGKQVAYYTPDQTGTWTLKFSFPGQTIENKHPPPPLPPGAMDPRRMAYVGDYFEPSSIEINFTVQEEQIKPYVEAPLPTGYWSRPINEQLWSWSQISGNVLAYPERYGVTQVAQDNPYTTAPESAHILWTRELTSGGLVGGEYGELSYHSGAAYEGKMVVEVIINGILYYNKYPQDLKYHPPATYAAPGPKPGFYAVDLRTGKEVYYNNDTRISFGQVYWYASPNQHGAFPYLWKIPETDFRVDPDPLWYCYDAYTGDLVYTIENAPSPALTLTSVTPGSRTFGPNGEILQYVLNTNNHWLALWNNTAIPELLAGTDYYAWMWRPWGKTVDGRKGYVWNVTVPSDVTGTVEHVLSDRLIGQTGLLSLIGYGAEVHNFTVWALSTKPGDEGRLLWKKTYELQDRDAMASMANCAVSEEHKLFTVYVAESRKHYAYSTETGEFLWSTESQGSWDYYYETHSYVAYDRLYSSGMDGTVYCYNITNGKLLWTFEAKNPTSETVLYGPNYPERLNIFADGKLYISSTIHSPLNPKFRGAPFVCLNATTGEELWQISLFRCAWGCEPIVADGIIVALDNYDNRIYGFGKGPSKTTVTAPQTVIPLGSSVVITGTVTDQSPGTTDYDITARYPNGVPAISDDNMTEWMEHLYRQFSKPEDAKGVTVKLETLDPNGNFYDIGTTTSDASGTYSLMWEPPVPGKYTIIATFPGSDSYYSSYAETAIGVAESPEATAPPTAPPASVADLYLVPGIVGIIIAIAVVGALLVLMLRKR